MRHEDISSIPIRGGGPHPAIIRPEDTWRTGWPTAVSGFYWIAAPTDTIPDIVWIDVDNEIVLFREGSAENKAGYLLQYGYYAGPLIPPPTGQFHPSIAM